MSARLYYWHYLGDWQLQVPFLRAARWPALIRGCLIIFADDLMPGVAMTLFNCTSMVKCEGDWINDKLEEMQNEAVIYFHVSLPLTPAPPDKCHGVHNSIIYFRKNDMSEAVHHFRMWYFVNTNPSISLFTNKLTLLLSPLIAELQLRQRQIRWICVWCCHVTIADVHDHMHDSIAKWRISQSSLKPLSVQQIITHPSSCLNLNLEFMELWTTIYEICCIKCKMVAHTNILDISTSIYTNNDITMYCVQQND
jgi:hypothetical protein